MNEFELITHFFANKTPNQRQDVILGVGDDCAVLTVPQGQQLLISMDTLVQGVHFPESTPPYDIGYKALAVNLSDLAAMGAIPAWFTLSLTVPSLDKSWLSAFSDGLFELAQEFNLQLVGGDTTRGPLSITIQVHGFAPTGSAITRSGAKPGDLIYVTHTLGDAGLALQLLLDEKPVPASILKQLNRPYPRVEEGLILREFASAMIDISDGLIADLSHILNQSKVGAVIHTEQLPLSEELTQAVDPAQAIQYALSAGDDYELCFTIPAHKREALQALMSVKQRIIHCIGQITETKELVVLQDNQPIEQKGLRGYSHF
jgi:thiamine-monophosphate kinase